VSESRTIRVLIVEDHPVVRLGLRHVMEHEGLEVADVGSIDAALRAPALASADLVTIDLSLGGEDGLDLVRRLKRERPSLPVLVYSMFEDAAHIDRALRAGAKGYLTKGETFEVLEGAIRACLAGIRYLSPIAERNWIDSAEARRGLDVLSAQEQQVYALLGQGLSTSDIAEEMGVSPRTVESYFARIQVKLGLAGMKELRQQAIANPI
jgi:DNA-binding NarL/FixJ family response regulator